MVTTRRFVAVGALLLLGMGARAPHLLMRIRCTRRSRSSRRYRMAPPRSRRAALFDPWDYQLNIVQSTIGGRRQTILFTRREGSTAKPI